MQSYLYVEHLRRLFFLWDLTREGASLDMTSLDSVLKYVNILCVFGNCAFHIRAVLEFPSGCSLEGLLFSHVFFFLLALVYESRIA